MLNSVYVMSFTQTEFRIKIRNLKYRVMPQSGLNIQERSVWCQISIFIDPKP